MDKYYKLGYVWDKELENVTEEDAKILTHINIAFGLVEDGKVKTSHLKNNAQLARIRELNPDIKIVLSVGGWGAGGFSTAVSTPAGQDKFAESAFEAYKTLGLDGIDIDWEYPTIDSAGIDASPDDKYNFTFMLQKIREALPGGALLTIAVGSGEYFIEGTEMDKVQKYLDYVMLMTYDMASTDMTVHHTNLFDSNDAIKKSSTENSVRIFNEAGVPFEKLVIGAAFYSREWKDVDAPGTDGLYQKKEGWPGFGAKFSDLDKNFIDKNGYKRYWDDVAKAPYLFNGTNFYSYDDEQSIALKCEYVKQKNLLGIMYWEHSCDETRKLLRAISKNL
jgi:chitinase